MSHPRERHGARRNRPDPRTASSLVFLQRNPKGSKSGVDFWHAVEFSRNGRFLRNPSGPLRALPFVVSPAYQTCAVLLAVPIPAETGPLFGDFHHSNRLVAFCRIRTDILR